MSYVTRPIRGFQITFLTSVQPSDRLPRFVREHSRLSRSFSTTSRIYRLFVISRRAALCEGRSSGSQILLLRTFFSFGLRFFVSLSQVLQPAFLVSQRFIPFYSQRFLRSIAFPRFSPFYPETFYTTLGFQRRRFSVLLRSSSVQSIHFVPFSLISLYVQLHRSGAFVLVG